MCRTSGYEEFNAYQDSWINKAWKRLSELFVVPALNQTSIFDSVADQQYYLLPYDYNGTEVGLKYLNRRLDPIADETLRLKYERRTGNMGRVDFYDWSGVIGENLFSIAECILTNESAVVLCASTDVRLDTALWVRFDPYVDANNADREDDIDNMVNPGDYGYLIDAGNFVSGASFRLTTPYRGPSGIQFTCRVRPAEQQQFLVYGVPAAAGVGAFDLRYAAKPRRLYNNKDVPEWPDMSEAISYMAISVAMEWHNHLELSKSFWGKAMQRVQGLKQRRNKSKSLVSDVTIGSVTGRHTGIRGVMTGERYRSGRYR